VRWALPLQPTMTPIRRTKEKMVGNFGEDKGISYRIGHLRLFEKAPTPQPAESTDAVYQKDPAISNDLPPGDVKLLV
jgi:hypothetical protein